MFSALLTLHGLISSQKNSIITFCYLDTRVAEFSDILSNNSVDSNLEQTDIHQFRNKNISSSKNTNYSEKVDSLNDSDAVGMVKSSAINQNAVDTDRKDKNSQSLLEYLGGYTAGLNFLKNFTISKNRDQLCAPSTIQDKQSHMLDNSVHQKTTKVSNLSDLKLKSKTFEEETKVSNLSKIRNSEANKKDDNDTEAKNSTSDDSQNNKSSKNGEGKSKEQNRKLILDTQDSRFKNFMEYCQSPYSIPPQKDSMVLEKLIVIHRHGDRSPLALYTTGWESKTCYTSSIKDEKLEPITETKCADGALTQKGYEQMKALGTFIKNHYQSLDLSNLKARCTQTPRTAASLHGVLTGLNNDTKVRVECPFPDSLVIQRNCEYLNTLMQRTISDYFTDLSYKDEINKTTPDMPPQRFADQYLTALCNSIEIDCSKVNCDLEIIREYIDTALTAWKDQADRVRKIDAALGIVFGRFAGELLNYLKDKTQVRVISVHDSSLTSILAGLGAEISIHPPFASAIFLEKWKNVDEHFVRVIFNDRTIKTTIDQDENIPLEKLEKYLQVLVTDSAENIKRCEEEPIVSMHNVLSPK